MVVVVVVVMGGAGSPPHASTWNAPTKLSWHAPCSLAQALALSGLHVHPPQGQGQGFLADTPITLTALCAQVLGPGFRLGWVSGPAPLVAKIALGSQASTVGPAGLSQVGHVGRLCMPPACVGPVALARLTLPPSAMVLPLPLPPITPPPSTAPCPAGARVAPAGRVG